MIPFDQDSFNFLYKKAFHIPTPDHVALKGISIRWPVNFHLCGVLSTHPEVCACEACVQPLSFSLSPGLVT